jgi:ABC-type lipoprotein release transport system permease subunit
MTMRLLPWDYAVRNLGRSPLRLALSAGGGALVVALVLAAGAFVRGMERSLAVSAAPDNVILLGAGSEESLERSEIDPAVPSLLAASVEGIRSRAGVAYVSPEVHLMTEVQEQRGGRGIPVLLRGVTPEAFLVHSQVRVIEGRAAEPGRDELVVGRLAHTRMGLRASRLAPGQTLWFDQRPWTIVGTFEAPATVMDAELWVPLRDLQIAARRENLSCVVTTLGPGAQFDDVALFAKQRLDLELVPVRERDYYANLLAFFSPVRAMVWVTSLLMATGGLFGGLNTMYAAFASRVRELGALQAIGFSRAAVVVSLVQESVLATAAGSLLAAAAALLLLDGVAVRFSMGAFGLVVDGPVLAGGLAAGLLLGVVGALPPVWRALKMPITDALKSA